MTKRTFAAIFWLLNVSLWVVNAMLWWYSTAHPLVVAIN